MVSISISAVPLHVRKIWFPGPSLVPRPGDRRNSRRTLTDQERCAPRLLADRSFYHLDVRRSGEQHAQQPREVRLRFDGHDTASHRGKGTRSVAGMRAEIEDQVAARDKLRIEATQAALSQRDRVIDRKRAKHSGSTVGPAHQRVAATSKWPTTIRDRPASTWPMRRARHRAIPEAFVRRQFRRRAAPSRRSSAAEARARAIQVSSRSARSTRDNRHPRNSGRHRRQHRVLPLSRPIPCPFSDAG